MFGGEHPNSFTQNTIISLGNDSYIEILAPRADADSIPDWIAKLDSLAPVGWGVATRDIAVTKSKLEKLNLITSNTNPGSRKTPRGDTLRWTTFGLQTDTDTPFPFFIKWDKNTIHPSRNAPTGCSLNRIGIISNSDALEKVLKSLDIHFELTKAQQEKIMVVINSPKGQVTFK